MFVLLYVMGDPAMGKLARSYKRAANICKDWGTLSGEGASFAQCDEVIGSLGKIWKEVK